MPLQLKKYLAKVDSQGVSEEVIVNAPDRKEAIATVTRRFTEAKVDSKVLSCRQISAERADAIWGAIEI